MQHLDSLLVLGVTISMANTVNPLMKWRAGVVAETAPLSHHGDEQVAVEEVQEGFQLRGRRAEIQGGVEKIIPAGVLDGLVCACFEQDLDVLGAAESAGLVERCDSPDGTDVHEGRAGVDEEGD